MQLYKTLLNKWSKIFSSKIKNFHLTCSRVLSSLELICFFLLINCHTRSDLRFPRGGADFQKKIQFLSSPKAAQKPRRQNFEKQAKKKRF